MDLINNLNVKNTSIINTATSVVLYLTRTPKEKRVEFFQNNVENKKGLFQPNGIKTPIFEKVSVLKFNVEDDIEIAEHPLENGAIVTDHLKITPAKITSLIMISEDDNESINELLYFHKNGILLSIKAGAEYYNNMAITKKPFEIKSEVFDKIVYSVEFVEILKANTQFLALPNNKVNNESDSSTIDDGAIRPLEISNKSILSKIKQKIQGIL